MAKISDTITDENIQIHENIKLLLPDMGVDESRVRDKVRDYAEHPSRWKYRVKIGYRRLVAPDRVVRRVCMRNHSGERLKLANLVIAKCSNAVKKILQNEPNESSPFVEVRLGVVYKTVNGVCFAEVHEFIQKPTFSTSALTKAKPR